MESEKPQHIKKAMIDGDTDLLRAAQRKSVEARRKNGEQRKDLKDLAQQIQQEEAQMTAIEHEANRILHEEGEEAMNEWLKKLA